MALISKLSEKVEGLEKRLGGAQEEEHRSDEEKSSSNSRRKKDQKKNPPGFQDNTAVDNTAWQTAEVLIREQWGCEVGAKCVLNGEANGVRFGYHYAVAGGGTKDQRFQVKIEPGGQEDGELSAEAKERLSSAKGRCDVLKLFTCCTHGCVDNLIQVGVEDPRAAKECNINHPERGKDAWTKRCLGLKSKLEADGVECEVKCSSAPPRYLGAQGGREGLLGFMAVPAVPCHLLVIIMVVIKILFFQQHD